MDTLADRGDSNPYEAPRSAVDYRSPVGDRPPLIFFVYALYCGLVATLYGGLGLLSMLDDRFGVLINPDRDGLPHYSVACLAIAAIFAAGPFLPRRPWAWTYGLIVIVMGIVITWPFGLFWLGRGARGYYARIPDCVRLISEYPHASRSSARLPGLRRG